MATFEFAYLQTILPITATSPISEPHQQAQRKLLRRKKSEKNQVTVKATQLRHASERY